MTGLYKKSCKVKIVQSGYHSIKNQCYPDQRVVELPDRWLFVTFANSADVTSP